MAAAAVRTFKADPAAGELPFAAVGFDDVERAFLAATLDDPRGWGAYGFRFRPVPLRALHGDDKKGKTGKRRGAHDIVIELVEPAEMEARFPYAHLRGLSVCDSSDAHHPRIALHAGNWRAPPAASGYGDNVWAYRAYVVNHETDMNNTILVVLILAALVLFAVATVVRGPVPSAQWRTTYANLRPFHGRTHPPRVPIYDVPLEAIRRDRDARRRAWVLVPYRDATYSHTLELASRVVPPEHVRAHHLQGFLRDVVPVLLDAAAKASLPPPRVVVVHQADGARFNKAQILNAAVAHLLTQGERGDGLGLDDSLVLHDADYRPSAVNAEYAVSALPYPLHLAGLHGKYRYGDFFGGVVSMPARFFVAANGFPNTYWGWGGEDDALLGRVRCAAAATHGLLLKGAVIGRSPYPYPEVDHAPQVGNPANPHNKVLLADDTARAASDGLLQTPATVVGAHDIVLPTPVRPTSVLPTPVPPLPTLPASALWLDVRTGAE